MDINDWRKKIDSLEDSLIALLNERASYALEIGKLKKQLGLPVLDASRENEILERVAKKSKGPLSADSVKLIFATLMQETRKVEE
ncbi:MAG: chorismate mutase [Fibrobacteraceae bacterium]|jgi:chorismate mutase|nr:chorismate mutase [Fibrobacteraceae bacterium]MBQ5610351.1 chorismate mutase [Fibrobacteraceae bacterium]